MQNAAVISEKASAGFSAPAPASGMSSQNKTLLFLGGVVLLSAGIYFIYNSGTEDNPKKTGEKAGESGGLLDGLLNGGIGGGIIGSLPIKVAESVLGVVTDVTKDVPLVGGMASSAEKAIDSAKEGNFVGVVNNTFNATPVGAVVQAIITAVDPKAQAEAAHVEKMQIANADLMEFVIRKEALAAESCKALPRRIINEWIAKIGVHNLAFNVPAIKSEITAKFDRCQTEAMQTSAAAAAAVKEAAEVAARAAAQNISTTEAADLQSKEYWARVKAMDTWSLANNRGAQDFYYYLERKGWINSTSIANLAQYETYYKQEVIGENIKASMSTLMKF